MRALADWFFIIAAACGCLLTARPLVHVLQLESYQFAGYFRSLKRQLPRLMLPGLILTAALALLMGCAAGLMNGAGRAVRVLIGVLLIALSFGAGWLIRRRARLRQAKKPLVVTPRIKRLYAAAAICWTLVFLAATLVLPAWSLCFSGVLLPLLLALAALAAWPVERLINRMYYYDARRRLKRRDDLIRIGITGSYGKTSVKFILGTLLSEKYQVRITPHSFNTAMGVTRTIRERLRPEHQVFVAEMGARHPGDIRELTRLVRPTLGLLTSVGPQHLDTFRTVERITRTKYDLIEALPADGDAFFAEDGGICRALWAKTEKPKHLCSLEPSPDAEVWAEDIAVSKSGSSFRLCTKDFSVPCKTRLLGDHNIQNILLAAMAALRLGLTPEQLAHGIARLEPVEHRLQLMPSSGGLTVIDDAFNSNPKGASNALKALAAFPQRRVLVTPGMVELGAEEADFNRAFGREAAAAADLIILVGKRHTAPIVEGLTEAGFPEENLHVTASLDEASALLARLARPGDTVLFENDLPDHYSEA